jgi:hypothetical protein
VLWAKGGKCCNDNDNTVFGLHSGYHCLGDSKISVNGCRDRETSWMVAVSYFAGTSGNDVWEER